MLGGSCASLPPPPTCKIILRAVGPWVGCGCVLFMSSVPFHSSSRSTATDRDSDRHDTSNIFWVVWSLEQSIELERLIGAVTFKKRSTCLEFFKHLVFWKLEFFKHLLMFVQVRVDWWKFVHFVHELRGSCRTGKVRAYTNKFVQMATLRCPISAILRVEQRPWTSFHSPPQHPHSWA